VRNNDGNNGNDDTASGSHGVPLLLGKDLDLIFAGREIRVIQTASTRKEGRSKNNPHVARFIFTRLL